MKTKINPTDLRTVPVTPRKSRNPGAKTQLFRVNVTNGKIETWDQNASRMGSWVIPVKLNPARRDYILGAAGILPRKIQLEAAE